MLDEGTEKEQVYMTLLKYIGGENGENEETEEHPDTGATVD